MKHLFVVLMVLGSTVGAFAMGDDSLHKAISTLPDTMKVQVLYKESYKRVTTESETSLRLANEAYALSLKIHYPRGAANSQFYIGAVYQGRADYKTALVHVLNAARIHDSLHRPKNLAIDYDDIGLIFENMRDYASAMNYFRKGLSLAILTHYEAEECHIYSNMGRSFDLSGHYDSAFYYRSKAKELGEKMGDQNAVNQALAEMGILSVKQGRQQEGLDYYLKALPYFEKVHDTVPWGMLYQNISGVYLSMKKYAESKKYAMLGMQLLKNNKEPDVNLRFYEALYSAEKLQGNYKEALAWHEKMTALNDSIYSASSSKQVAELATKYETAKKEEQINLQNLEISRRGILIYAGFGFALLILVGTGIGYVNYRKTQRLSVRLAEQRNALEDLNKLKDKLFSIISHDLRSPLNNTHAMLELLQRGEISEDKMKRFTQTLSDTLQDNIQLLDNLLNWAASQLKGAQINKREINVRELIEENLASIQSTAERKNIALVEQASEDAMVYADLSMARVVMRNLLSNALKFTPEGGKITVQAMTTGNEVTIVVADTGVGMENAMKNSVFSGSPNESTPGTKNEKGFGIGLNLCKEFVEKNDGRIYVESQLGQGSRFSFTLPMVA